MNFNRITSSLLVASAMVSVLGCSKSSSDTVETIVNAPLTIQITDHDLETGLQKNATSGNFLGSFTDAVIYRNNDDDDGDDVPDDEDMIVNGADDFMDMTQITISGTEMKVGSKLTFSEDAVGNFNAFLSPDMTLLDLSQPLDLSTMAGAGDSVSFYLEATQFAGPDFDGTIELTVDSVSGTKTRVLKVAPWLMLSNASEAQELFIREHTGRNDTMIAQLKTILPQAGVELTVIPASAPYDSWNIWLQDAIEIGRQFKPDSSMPVVLQANRNKSIDAFSKDSLLGQNFGWMNVGEFRPDFGAGNEGTQWLDWFGNLEVSPPLPGHPHGRVYFGENKPGEQMDPLIISMIDAQKLQGPAFKMDVSFLIIKHADETVSFVPSGNPDMPWYALVPTTEGFIELAKKWQSEGHGDVPFLDRFESDYTINKFLADTKLVEHNLAIQRGPLNRNKATLMRELGLPAEAIIEIPGAIKFDGASLIPNMVNSAMVNDYYLVPDPNGPVVNGKDLLQAEFNRLLEPSTLNIEFIDDRQYHKWLGNVHCATNVVRSGEEQFEAMK